MEVVTDEERDRKSEELTKQLAKTKGSLDATKILIDESIVTDSPKIAIKNIKRFTKSLDDSFDIIYKAKTKNAESIGSAEMILINSYLDYVDATKALYEDKKLRLEKIVNAEPLNKFKAATYSLGVIVLVLVYLLLTK